MKVYEVGDDKNFDIELALARTLTSILDQVDAPLRVRCLSPDVEGEEMEVLKGLDFSKYLIGWILVEIQAPAKVFLMRKRYFFHSQLTPHDYLFHFGQ